MRGENTKHQRQVVRRAFTLIELLVVISIVVLLMALLLPALSRARKQARAVVCQSRLHGWSLMFAAYQNDNEGRFPDSRYSTWDEQAGQRTFSPFFWPLQMEFYSDSDLRDTMVCPMASKSVPPAPYRTRGMGVAAGATFLAWRLDARMMEGIEVARTPYSEYIGSYAINTHLCSHSQLARRNVKRSAYPVLLDSRGSHSGLYEATGDGPPPYEDYELGTSPPSYSAAIAINRHQEGLHILFADGTLRKVGVKELWTLKWRKDFDTAGPWTKAGGMHPEDWPEWMRPFKDY